MAQEPTREYPGQQKFFEQCATLIRRWHNWTISGDPGDLSSPVLVVSHHGFGTMTDPGVYANFASLGELNTDLPISIMMHDMNWKMGMGKMVDRIGGVPASRDAFANAVAAGHHLSVAPGGDYDTARRWKDRNTITFYGRSGFARLAIQEGTPIVPLVTAGAAEGALVLANGIGAAKKLRLNKIPGMKTMPVSVSVPWGVTVGGPPPYVPLPVRLETRMVPQITPKKGETPEQLAMRVQRAMQEAMDDMVSRRGPLLGYPRKHS